MSSGSLPDPRRTRPGDDQRLSGVSVGVLDAARHDIRGSLGDLSRHLRGDDHRGEGGGAPRAPFFRAPSVRGSGPAATVTAAAVTTAHRRHRALSAPSEPEDPDPLSEEPLPSPPSEPPLSFEPEGPPESSPPPRPAESASDFAPEARPPTTPIVALPTESPPRAAVAGTMSSHQRRQGDGRQQQQAHARDLCVDGGVGLRRVDHDGAGVQHETDRGFVQQPGGHPADVLAPPRAAPVRHGGGGGHGERAHQDDHHAEPDPHQERVDDAGDDQQASDDQQQHVRYAAVAVDALHQVEEAAPEEVLGVPVHEVDERADHGARGRADQNDAQDALERGRARFAASVQGHLGGGEEDRAAREVHGDPPRLVADHPRRRLVGRGDASHGHEDPDGALDDDLGDHVDHRADGVGEHPEEVEIPVASFACCGQEHVTLPTG